MTDIPTHESARKLKSSKPSFYAWLVTQIRPIADYRFYDFQDRAMRDDEFPRKATLRRLANYMVNMGYPIEQIGAGMKLYAEYERCRGYIPVERRVVW